MSLAFNCWKSFRATHINRGVQVKIPISQMLEFTAAVCQPYASI